MRTLALLFVMWLVLCFTVIGVAASVTFNNYLDAQRDLQRKEQAEKMRLTIERGINELSSKIPDFKVFKRGEESNGSFSNSGNRGLVRVVGN